MPPGQVSTDQRSKVADAELGGLRSVFFVGSVVAQCAAPVAIRLMRIPSVASDTQEIANANAPAQ